MVLTEDFHRKLDRALELAELIRADRLASHQARELADLVEALNDELCEDVGSKEE